MATVGAAVIVGVGVVVVVVVVVLVVFCPVKPGSKPQGVADPACHESMGILFVHQEQFVQVSPLTGEHKHLLN